MGRWGGEGWQGEAKSVLFRHDGRMGNGRHEHDHGIRCMLEGFSPGGSMRCTDGVDLRARRRGGIAIPLGG